MSDVIKPSGMGASEETRKVVDGWKKIAEGTRETRQERILRERREHAIAIKEGRDPDEREGFRPGSEDSNEPVSMRKLMESHNKITNPQSNVKKVIFVGSGEQVTLKLSTVFEQAKDKGQAIRNIVIYSLEEAGFNKYKITYSIS